MHAHGLTIRTYASPLAAARALAGHICQAITNDPGLTLGLPTGRTPIPLYDALTSRFERGGVDFSRASTFNLDEFLGIPASDPRSYRAFMERHLFSRVNLSRRRIHFLDGTAADPDAECARYEQRIVRAGGLDLLILGLGTNGHIGFNEPGPTLKAVTHRTRLTASTRRSNAELFGNRPADVPREALSMGVGTILRARRIILLATGASKAHAVRRLVFGPVTTQLPASLLQLHRSAEVWVDRAAGAELSGTAA